MSPGPRPTSLLELVDGVSRFLSGRARSVVGVGSAAVVGSVLIAAFWLAGPSGWTAGTAVPLALVLGGVVALICLATWVARRSRGWSAEVRIAEELERTARLPDGSVRGQVELSRSVPGGVSGTLAAAGEASVLSRLTGSVQELAGRPGEALGRWLRMGVGLGLAAVGAVAVLLAANPARAGAAWGGLMRPVALLSPEPLPALEVSPGDAALPRGEAPVLEIGAVGRDSVVVHWQEIGELSDEAAISVATGRARATLPPLEAALRYWVSDGHGNETAVFTLTPADPSLLADLRIDVTYPSYTRLPNETFQVAPAWLRLPEGSTIAVSGRVQGTGTAIRLVGESGEPALDLPVENGGFAGGWRPSASGVITWEMDGGVAGAQMPDPMELEIIVDQSPALSLPVPGSDIDMPLDERVPLVAEAVDDYGVAWIEVDTRLVRDGQEGEPVLDRIPTNSLPQVALRPVLDFGTWGLEPGDEVLLRVRAADNAPVPHVVESAVYRLSVADEDALRAAARASIDEARSRSEELLDQIEREAAEQRDLQRRTEFGQSTSNSRRGATSDAQDFEEREELLRMLDQQAEVADALEALRAELTETREALEEMARSNEGDAALSAQLEEIEQMMEQVMTPEERARLDEMRDALREGRTPDTPEDLIRQMTEMQEDLQERLDRALETLERAQLDQAMREVEDEVRSLLEEQREVSGELDEAEGRQRQEALAERTDEARENLAQLEDEAGQSGDTGAEAQREEAAEDLGDAADSMREAAQEAQQGDTAEAEQAADAAADALAQALEQMEQAREDLQQSEEDRRDDALRQGVQDALALARRQAELRVAFGDGPLVRSEHVEEETAVRDGMATLQRNLQEAIGGDDPEVAGPIAAEAQRAVEAAGAVTEGLRGSTSGPQLDPRAFADSAQAALNRVAVLVLQSLGSQGQPPQQSGPGDEAAQTLSDLSEQQADINAESQRRARAADQGTPSAEELEQMVSGQQGIAAALQELADQRGPGFAGSQLDQLAEESAELAQELAQGRLDPPLIEQQDRFLQRLLDAGRTLEQDGPTNEREGTTAEETPRRAVTALPDALLDPAAFELPTAAQLDALSPGLRGLVLDYFERVNRRRAVEESVQ